MIERGWCRTLINRRVERVKRVFRWATAEELVPVGVYQALRAMPGLQRGRTAARESKPVTAVDTASVAATLPFVRPPVRAMIRLQELTGMRPGEACRLRLAEVDRSSEPWVYRPGKHKTRHRGKVRVIPLGPKAQAALVEFLRGDHPPPAGWEDLTSAETGRRLVAANAYEEAGRVWDAALLRDTGRPFVVVAGCVVDPGAPVFSPLRDREERFRALRRARKSKVPPSQRTRRKTRPARLPSAAYTPHAYAVAVARACDRARVAHWHPNQIRHTFASEVRRGFGLEAAQVLLGHARADTTEIYAERDLALAVRVAAEVG
jgi:integrase